MKFVIISTDYAPKINSGAIIVGDLVREFVNSGHGVIVVTFADSQSERYRVAEENGARVIRIGVGDRKRSRIRRALIERTYSRRIIETLKQVPDISCDGVICYSPSIFFGAAVSWLKKQRGVKAYLILRDIFPKWALEAGLLRKGPVYQYFKYIERKLYESVDVIGVEATADLEYFKTDAYVPHAGVEVLNNWSAPLDDIDPAYGHSVLDKNKVNILYGGNIGDAQDLLTLIRSLDPTALGDNAILTLVGDGDQAAAVKDEIAAHDLKNIVVLPQVDREKYLSLLAAADVGLISLNSKLKGHNYPLKMIGYTQMGKPLLASANAGNEIIDLIEEREIGLVSVAGDWGAFNGNVSAIVGDADRRHQMGENSRALFGEKFSAQSAVKQICKAFDEGGCS